MNHDALIAGAYLDDESIALIDRNMRGYYLSTAVCFGAFGVICSPFAIVNLLRYGPDGVYFILATAIWFFVAFYFVKMYKVRKRLLDDRCFFYASGVVVSKVYSRRSRWQAIVSVGGSEACCSMFRAPIRFHKGDEVLIVAFRPLSLEDTEHVLFLHNDFIVK